jgi:hypothetical protein
LDFSVPKGDIPSYGDLEEIICTFIEIMKTKPTVVDIPTNASVFYVGDLHGDFNCLKEALVLAESKDADYVVFLGDYVDRGIKQLETILAIIELAVRDEKFVTLRGNHEDSEMITRYGFFSELKKHYSDQNSLEIVKESFSTIFEFLPLAAVKGGSGSLAVHAGIPTYPDFDLVRMIPKPHSDIETLTAGGENTKEKVESVFQQIRWNDPQTWQFTFGSPSEELTRINEERILFFPSIRGEDIYLFNENALLNYLEQNNLSRIIRSHESIRGEFENVWEGKLLHFFSAYPYQMSIKEGRFLFELAYTDEKPVIEVLKPSGKSIECLRI